MAELGKFAEVTPFSTEQVNNAGKSLLAFGITTEDLIPTLKAVGDIASGTGKDFNELATIYGKAKVAGTLFPEDINQLTEAGVPIIQEFAKQLGVSTSEVKKLASEGKISFENLEEGFRSLTSEGGKFADLMNAQSQSLEGLQSTMNSNFDILKRRLVEFGTPALKEGINGISNLFSELIGKVDDLSQTDAPLIFAAKVKTFFDLIVASTENFLERTKFQAIKLKKFFSELKIGDTYLIKPSAETQKQFDDLNQAINDRATKNINAIKFLNNSLKQMGITIDQVNKDNVDQLLSRFDLYAGSVEDITDSNIRYILNLAKMKQANKEVASSQKKLTDEIKQTNDATKDAAKNTERNEQLSYIDQLEGKIAEITKAIELAQKSDGFVNAILKDEKGQELSTQVNNAVTELNRLKVELDRAKKELEDLLNPKGANRLMERSADNQSGENGDVEYDSDKELKAYKEYLDAEQAAREKADQKQKEDAKEKYAYIDSLVSQSSQLAISTLSAILQAERNNINERIALQDEAVKLATQRADKGNAEQLQLEKEKQEALQDEARKNAEKRRLLSITEAVINGALAISKTFAQMGFLPGLPFAALQAATTAVQISTIKSQKFAKGTEFVEGRGHHKSDSIPSYLSRGERVVDFHNNGMLEGISNDDLPLYANLGRMLLSQKNVSKNKYQNNDNNNGTQVKASINIDRKGVASIVTEERNFQNKMMK